MSTPTKSLTTSYSEFDQQKREWIEDLAIAGFALTGLLPNSKETIRLDWPRTKPDPMLSLEDFPNNYGVILRDDVLVLDIDTKNFTPGDNPLVRLKQALGMTPEEEFQTYTVKSRSNPGGQQDGLHFYFSKPRGVNLMSYSKPYGKGIELRSAGAYVVGPGSIHPDTKKPYTVVRGRPDSLLAIPQLVLNEFQRMARTLDKGLDEFIDDDSTRRLYIEYLMTAPVAVEGMDGDPTTYNVALVGRDFSLPEQATYDLMRMFWNDRCYPPWNDRQLAEKVRNAYRYAKDNIGNRHPAAAFDVVKPAESVDELKFSAAQKAHQLQKDRREADKRGELVWNIKGAFDPESLDEPQLKVTLNNIVNFFRRPFYESFDSSKNPFYRAVRYNLFTRQVEFRRRMPWHLSDESISVWTDEDTSVFREWLSQKRQMEVSTDMVLTAVIVAAQAYKYHPIKDYYKSLEWDGVPRIHLLMPYYAGSDDNAYTREVGRCLMRAIVSRVMQPGVKFDHLTILEGNQGTRKSMFCEILGRGYYSDLHIDPRNKDTQTDIMGKSVIELAEMSYNRKADVASMKAFFSKRVARARLPYGKISQDMPRECVFIGTTNETVDYLRDQTGNRRYWPILTGEMKIDELRRDIDQLYAEAYYDWRAGELHYFADETVIELAKEEQMKRTEVDPWETLFEEYVNREKRAGKVHRTFSIAYIAEEILNIPARQMDRVISLRISSMMRILGWLPNALREDGLVKRGFRNPNYDEDFDEIVRGV